MSAQRADEPLSASGLWQKLMGGWDTLAARPSKIIEARRIHDGSAPADSVLSQDHYFSAYISSMFLRNEGEWLKTYSPVAIVVAEYLYGGEKVVVPTVVGPSIIQQYVSDIPDAMTFSDTKVAGTHPYRGGEFALTVILARVQKTDFAQSFLRFLETTANAVGGKDGIGPSVAGFSKVATAVMRGVDELFGLKETQTLMGQRVAFDSNDGQWLTPGYYALVNKDVDQVRWRELEVQDKRLVNLGPAGSRYREADHVLLRLQATAARNDTTALPFWKKFEEIENVGLAATDDAGFEKAKAMMFALAQDVIHSPELTRKQAHEVIDDLYAKLGSIKILKDKNKGQLAAGPRAKSIGSRQRELIELAGGDVDGREEDLLDSAKLLSPDWPEVKGAE